MPSLSDVTRALGAIAPLHLAEPWDKVGLLIAGDGRPVTRALLAIDLTPEVLAEAIAARAELVVGYHPLLFKPLERLDGATWQGRVALDAVRAGIAVYSPHTALDAVTGGVNDWLVECVAGAGAGRASEIRALQPAAARGANTHKIVTFVPESSLEQVRTALAEAEAGQIGAYTHCSFASRGEGTFFGGEGANPALGKPGHLERVGEMRLEMSFHKRDLGAIVAALRAAHPYEEPAFDIFHLEAPPADPRVGAGRSARLVHPASTDEIAARLEAALGCGRIQRSRPASGAPRTHERFAVCAGSGASLLEAAASQGATLFVTGELSHHDVLRAHALGLEVLLAGHTNTERGYLPRLASALAAHAGVDCIVSSRDRDPLAVPGTNQAPT
jgi:dinuclear metal center YbgI/SA1388 family protein